MKFLVVGLGSMGKRRIRNLQYLKAGEIIGFDLRGDRCQESEDKYGIRTFKDFKTAIKESPDALIISVPSDKHHEYALLAARANKHFFTESNFLPEGMEDLIEIEKRKHIVAVPSLTISHRRSIKLMRKMVSEKKVGKILCFSYHLGAYLPDWHPWEDYRRVYFARQKTSGCREMVAFELTWFVWLLGDIKRVFCMREKVSNLEIDFPDVYQIVLEFKNGILGNMLVDVVSRPTIRECKLIGEEGTILWNSLEGWVKVFDAGRKSWKEYPEEAGTVEPGYSSKISEEPYVEEMEDFLKALKGEGTYPYSFEEEKRIVDLLLAIEKSAENNIPIEV